MGRDYVESSGADDSGQEPGKGDKRFSEMSPQEMRADKRVRLWVGGVLAVLGLIFVLQNTDSVRIRALMFTFDIPLIWVLVSMVLLGVVITLLVQWRGRRRAARSSKS